MKFKDKIIVVTGGGSDPGLDVVGFGHQTAKDLFDQGASVSILGTRPERLQDAMQRITGSDKPHDRFSCHECDVSNEARVKEVFELIKRSHGLIYGLVNNAAVNVRDPLLKAKISDIRRIIEINLVGPMACSKFALSQMLERGEGSIVNVTSIASKRIPLDEMPAYNASKRGLEGMSDSIVKDYGDRNIRSNIVRPGYARTPLTKNFLDSNPEKRKALEMRQPLGGLITPEQVSKGILYFLDPACKKTGEILEISNGHIPG